MNLHYLPMALDSVLRQTATIVLSMVLFLIKWTFHEHSTVTINTGGTGKTFGKHSNSSTEKPPVTAHLD